MATEEILIPDIGSFDSVDVIEILINEGDEIKKEDPLITVESDKASMDIPAPQSGVIKEIKLKVGDKVMQGSLIALVEKNQVSTEVSKKEPSVKKEIEDIASKVALEPTSPVSEPPATIQPIEKPLPISESALVASGKTSHASPSVRKFARNLGVNLNFVKGSALKNRKYCIA